MKATGEKLSIGPALFKDIGYDPIDSVAALPRRSV